MTSHHEWMVCICAQDWILMLEWHRTGHCDNKDPIFFFFCFLPTAMSGSMRLGITYTRALCPKYKLRKGTYLFMVENYL